MNYKLRLTTLIGQEIGRLNNPHQVAKRINQANAQASTGASISRKTLLKLWKAPEKVKLSLNHLIALDTYFAREGQGLRDRPLFEKEGLLECLVETRKVAFLLGSKPIPKQRLNDLSRWDTRSLAELLSQAGKFNKQIQFDIEDVLLRQPASEKAVVSEPWYRLLLDDDCSVVSIGSPLANLASEVMLARMFGVAPFVRPGPLGPAQEPLPFFHIWPPKVAGRFQSALALSWRELTAREPQLANAVRRNVMSAFAFESKVYRIPMQGQRWMMYGVIAAQRRGAGNVWLVVSGISGPATYAAATLVKRIARELPWTPGPNSPVLWVPIQAAITTVNSKSLGDNRVMDLCKLLGEPRIWPESKAEVEALER